MDDHPISTLEYDKRNIIDRYKHWANENILQDLATKRFNYSVLAYNLGYDYNIATVVRNSNAFMADKVYIWPRRRWDKRGAVGTYHYTEVKHVTQLDSLDEIHPGAIWIAIDNVGDAQDINDFEWPTDKHIILCVGQESSGLPKEVLDKCQHTLYIKQYGTVRSLNVGTASGLAMFMVTRALTGYRNSK